MQVSAINFNRDIYNKKLKEIKPSNCVSSISFKGADFKQHNLNQILSICPEHKGVELGQYSKGGLAVVTQEAPLSWIEKNVDIRTILPYHFITKEKKGGMALVRLPQEEYKKFVETGKYPNFIQKSWIHEVSANYKPTKSEFFAVINNSTKKEKDKLTKKEIEKGYKYIRLEPTEVKGKVRTLKEGYFQEEYVPYRLFKSFGTKGEPKYFMWTPQLAAMGEAYGMGNQPYYAGQVISGNGGWADFYYANFNRAVVDSLPQLAEKEGFNPASVWMHDRPMFSAQFEILNRVLKGNGFYNGYKLMSTLHNPGKDYQGWLEDVVGAFKILFDDISYDKLKNSPDFEIIKNIISKEGKRTKEDEQIIKAMFGKYFGNLLDEAGKPNLTMVPILNSKLNAELSKVGTVSLHYDLEMKTIKGIAEGLTSRLAEIETNSVTNGSLPANLNIDNRNQFGLGDNGLSYSTDGYTPYKPILDDNGKVLNYDKKYKNATLYKYAQKVEKLKKEKDKKLEPFLDFWKKHNIKSYKKLIEFEKNLIKKKLNPHIKLLNKKLEAEKALQEKCKAEAEKLSEKIKIKEAIPYKSEEIKAQLQKLKEELKEKVQLNKDFDKKIEKLNINIDRTKRIIEKAESSYFYSPNQIKAIQKRLKEINDFLPTGNEKKDRALGKPRYIPTWVQDTSVKEAKEANKKWALDLIAEQGGDKEKLKRVFYNSNQINDKKFEIIGNLSKYEPNDIVFTNWGRPDPQKGFSTFLEGYIKFLEDSSVKDSDKKRIKLLFGSGGGKWPKGLERERDLIIDAMNKIKQLGYGNNCLYVNGFFPNKLVACSDFGMFTSRFEPCGITPFESYSAGVPVASIRTGGAGNFVKDLNDGAQDPTGILTKRPFMLSEEELAKEGKFDEVAVKKKILGKKTVWTEEMQKTYEFKLDDARREVMTEEVSALFKRCIAAKDDKNGLYDRMCKNACEQQIEWARNAAYNNGRSADDVYLNSIFEISKERKQTELNKLTGEIGDGSDIKLTKIADSVEANVNANRKNAANKISQGAGFLKRLTTDRRTMLVAASIAAVAGITAYALTKEKSKNENRIASKIGNSKVYF